ncbi:hypothetical protein L1987_19816 [Smallanthus sonchifolius]|uniref:Uncharacterized protein n=1 Tax=Smallanthus sonchifolius TaxID=185202 RepID=A0ACB9IRS0_9ASTR|nr:hypothetical protein L1987_19816 [Smallanthus sonchifolius]
MHGGVMKPPKVLVDIVESVAAAVRLLEPLAMLDIILAQPQPISALYEACQKEGRQSLLEPLAMLDVILAQPQPISALYEACQNEGSMEAGYRNIASVFVDDTFIASDSSQTKENAKLHAAEAALSKLTKPKGGYTNSQTNVDFNELVETKYAKKKRELGLAHAKRFVSSVQLELPDAIFCLKVKDTENSTASKTFRVLRKAGYA